MDQERIAQEQEEPQELDALIPGSTLAGSFLVESLVHKGLVASLYRARQLSTDRVVAIKVLHRADNQEAVARLHREAINLSQGKYPGIVQALSCGSLPDGRVYLVMEYLEGGSLAQAIKRVGKLDGASFLNVFSQVLAALSHAHEQGIIHRDLKPANIMLGGGELSDCQAKIVDFGLSVDEKQSGQGLTKTGKIMGTPQYMSPEQCRGEDADYRCDLYSLGVMMYEAALGKPPFQADSALALMSMQLLEKAPRLNSVPPALAGLISEALEKEAEKRPASAAEMLKILQAISPSDWAKFPALKGSSSISGKTIAFIGAGCCVLVLALLLFRTKYGADLLAGIYCSGKSGEEKIIQLEKLRRNAGTLLGKDADVELITEELKEARITYSKREHVKARLRKSQLFDERRSLDSEKYFEVLGRYVEHVPDDKLKTVELSRGLIDLAQRKRNAQEALTMYRRAFEMLERFPQSDPKSELEARKGYANILLKTAKYDEALRAYSEIEPPDPESEGRSIAMLQSQYETKWGVNKAEQKSLKQDILINKAVCLQERERYDEAVAALSRAVGIEAASGPSEDLFELRNNLAKALCKSGRVKEAQEVLQKNFLEMIGFNNKVLALNTYYCAMSECALAQGDKGRAMTLLLEAIDGFRSAHNALMGRPEALLTNEGRLAEAYFDLLDLLKPGSDDYEEQLAECKTHCMMVLRSDSVLRARLNAYNARASLARREYEHAQKLVDEALANLDEDSSKKKLIRLSVKWRTMELKGDIEKKLGDLPQAIECYKAALVLSKRRSTLNLLAKLGLCQEKLGRNSEAMESYEKLFALSKSSRESLPDTARIGLKSFAGLEESLGNVLKARQIRSLL